GERARLRAPFEAGRIPGWDVVEADSLERARFALPLDPCDVLLIDASLYRAAGLAWLTREQRLPVLFLAHPDPALVLEALDNGAWHWLPRDLALGHPALLAAVLRRLASL